MDDKLVVFANELCELLKKHKLGNFTGEFTSGHDHEPYAVYHFNWNSGRHEEETGILKINYSEQKYVHLDLHI